MFAFIPALKHLGFPAHCCKWTEETDRMYHEWVPVDMVLNISAYTPGDYRIFLFNHAQKVDYRKWAKYLLSAEDWTQRKAKGETEPE